MRPDSRSLLHGARHHPRWSPPAHRDRNLVRAQHVQCFDHRQLLAPSRFATSMIDRAALGSTSRSARAHATGRAAHSACRLSAATARRGLGKDVRRNSDRVQIRAAMRQTFTAHQHGKHCLVARSRGRADNRRGDVLLFHNRTVERRSASRRQLPDRRAAPTIHVTLNRPAWPTQSCPADYESTLPPGRVDAGDPQSLD